MLLPAKLYGRIEFEFDKHSTSDNDHSQTDHWTKLDAFTNNHLITMESSTSDFECF